MSFSLKPLTASTVDVPAYATFPAYYFVTDAGTAREAIEDMKEDIEFKAKRRHDQPWSEIYTGAWRKCLSRLSLTAHDRFTGESDCLPQNKEKGRDH